MLLLVFLHLFGAGTVTTPVLIPDRAVSVMFSRSAVLREQHTWVGAKNNNF